MKNDLISRSALMNHLRGNVLVDVTPALEQAVKDEPTAYDVDSVKEQLKEHFNSTDDKTIRLAYHHAFEIVNGGCADE